MGTSAGEDAQCGESIQICDVVAILPTVGRDQQPISPHVLEMIGMLADLPPRKLVHMIRKCPDAALATFLRNLPDNVVVGLVMPHTARFRPTKKK